MAVLQAQELFSIILSLAVSSTNVSYYGCTTEIVTMRISVTVVMFWSVMFSVTH
jgi:hypothetical protein